jgi:hypothetical protein
MSKKKLIRILPRKGSPGHYGASTGMSFAFSSAPINGERYQASGEMTCREYFNRAVKEFVNNETSGPHHIFGKDAPIDLEKLRILVLTSADGVKEYKKKLFNAKAALNRLEEMAGFESTSKITTVKHKNFSNAWLITGPKEWMSQPQLLSLATWILRVVNRYGPINVNSYDTVEESFRLMYEHKETSNLMTNDVTSFCKMFWDKMYVLLKYRKEIFDKIKIQDAWSKEKGTNFSVYSGFYSFITEAELLYNPHVTRAQSKFRKLCNKHLPRKNSVDGKDLELWYVK